MKTLSTIMLVIMLAVVGQKAMCENKNEELYKEKDRLIWAKYEDSMERIRQQMQQCPEKCDSLRKEAEKALEIAVNENVETAKLFASTPSGIERLFTVRLRMPKDELKSVIDTLPEETKNSPYFNCIRKHIELEQVKAGDQYAEMSLYDNEGKELKLSSLLDGKRSILVFDGLSCMGKQGRDALRNFVKEGVNVVIYIQAENIKGLQDISNTYPIDGAAYVSELKGDHGDFKVVYGTQATPTIFLVDAKGQIAYESEGLYEDALKGLLK